MIMSGSRDATLHDVRLIDIHGTRFYDVRYALEAQPEQVLAARLAVEDVYADPQPGDAISIRFLMNVPVSVARR